MHNYNKLALSTILGFCILLSANCTGAPGTQTTGNSNQSSQSFNVKEFVGKITGTEALIGFSVNGSKVTAFVAGDDNTWKNYSAWFSGEINNNFFSLTSDDNRVLTGKFSAANAALSSAAEGKVTLADGTILNWTANVATPDTAAGLYRREDSNSLIGLVVNNDFKTQGVIFRKLDQNKIESFQLKVVDGLNSNRCIQVGYNNTANTLQTFNIIPSGGNSLDCTPSGTSATPNPNVTFTPFPTAIPTATTTPQPLPTSLATATPLPTAIPTATPTPSPTPVPTPAIPTNLRVVSLAGKASTSGFEDGTDEDALFNAPKGLAIDDSNRILVADSGNLALRRVTTGGVSTTLLSGSPPTFDTIENIGDEVPFNNPGGVAVDSNGNIYIADGNRIRKIDDNDNISVVFSTDSSSTTSIKSLAIDKDDNVYFTNGSRIDKLTSNGNSSIIAGNSTDTDFINGNGTTARFDIPRGIAVDKTGKFLFVADSNNSVIRRINMTTSANTVTTFSGSSSFGFLDGPATTAKFNNVRGLAIDSNGTLYVTDINNRRLRMVDANGFVRTIAGNGDFSSEDGTGTNSSFTNPDGLAIDSTGNILYMTDENMIRKITIR
jgi:sugar lactone lactonase YvrE